MTQPHPSAPAGAPRSPSLLEIEQALDSGRLFIAMHSGAFWRARRNGKTRVPARRPDHFSVPFKVGLRGAGRITHEWTDSHFRIEEDV